jgi:hypothetical protein
MDFKNVNWSNVLDSLSGVATVFNPVVGRGLMVASDIVDKLDDNDVLENNVIGLTRSVEILDKMIMLKEIDYEQLSFISSNLKSLETVVSKTAKLLK